MIRLAKLEDLQSLTYIYNQAVRTQNCTADMDEFTIDQRKDFFDAHQNEAYPLYVYQVDDKVVGYVYLSGYRPGRRAMNGTVEISYYLDHDYLGQGMGSKLMAFGIQLGKDLKYKTMVAILLGSNQASIGLLQKFEFEEWGRIKNIAEFDDYTTDHLYFGLKL